MNDEEVFNLDKAAAFAQLSKVMLRRAIKRKALSAALLPSNNGFRLLKSNVVAWIAAGCPGTEPEARSEDET